MSVTAPCTPISSGRSHDAACYVRFGTFDTALGVMLVASTQRGICHVALGDDTMTLERELRAAFPQAMVHCDPPHVAPWAARLADALTGSSADTAFPLDLRGSPFQHRVWAELQRIPAGETRSYQQLADSVGRPMAARAVARACATNPVAVIVPCHRVVRGTGALSGYRWGIDRKRALLDAERKASETSGARHP